MNTPTPLNGTRQRKNNLTQQDRNRRRQRATPEQVRVLCAEFEKNPTPTALQRIEIGNRIDMTQRSVQIWFQNNRAKVKKNNRRGVNGTTNSVTPQYRPSAPRYVVAAGNGDSLGGGIYLTGHATAADGFIKQEIGSAFGVIGESNNVAHPNLIAKTPYIEFPILSLMIGQWRRESTPSEDNPDMKAMYDPVSGKLSYLFHDQINAFRIDCEFRQVDSVYLFKEEGDSNIGILIVNMNRHFTPSFYVKQGNTGWLMSNDFTTDSQASTITSHTITGEIDILTENLGILHRFQPSRVRRPLPTPPASSSDSNATLWISAPNAKSPSYTWNDVTAHDVSPLPSPDRETGQCATANSSAIGSTENDTPLLFSTGGLDSTLLPGEDLMQPMSALTGELDAGSLDYMKTEFDIKPELDFKTEFCIKSELDMMVKAELDIKTELVEDFADSADVGILDQLNLGPSLSESLLSDPVLISNDSSPNCDES